MSESDSVPCPATPAGSLERTVDRDDFLSTIQNDDDVDTIPDDDHDESTELQRMVIRLGGNGF
jgi:hypothetical protein